MIRCLCDCGEETITLLAKVRSSDPKQWTRSCGCLKDENYLKHWAKKAKKVAPSKRKIIFEERCSGIDAFVIAKKHQISKDLVDSVVRHRQGELKSHKNLEVVKNGVLAKMPYQQIAILSGLETHEVAWLAKRIRAEQQLQLDSLRKSADLEERLVDSAYADLGHLQLILAEQNRRHFRAPEWSQSTAGYVPKGGPNRNAMFAYSIIGLLEVHATTPDRKELLRWFRTTIAKTIVHRENLRKQHAIKSSHSQNGSHLDEHEFELAGAA
jgi:hypothetical protein